MEFEHYLQRLLSVRGYSVDVTPASGDLGVDLIAVSGKSRVAIQAKRQRNNVSRRAVSDAVAGAHHYGCNEAMVITNSYFTAGAVRLARSTGCRLVDRTELADWISQARVAA